MSSVSRWLTLQRRGLDKNKKKCAKVREEIAAESWEITAKRETENNNKQAPAVALREHPKSHYLAHPCLIANRSDAT